MKVIKFFGATCYLASIFSGFASAVTGLLTFVSLLIAQTISSFTPVMMNGITLCRTLLMVCILCGFCYAVIEAIAKQN